MTTCTNLAIFILILSLFFLLCSAPPTESPLVKKEAAPKDTSRQSKVDSLPKPKKPKKIKDPIMHIAKKNSLFNASQWLKSDRGFFTRQNPLKLSPYDPIIKKMARRYGFDWRLIAAQIYTESNFRKEARSHVGATGLMQIMPRTAKYMGCDPKRLIIPEINIAVGCMYDQRMYNLWGRQTKDYNRLAFALASYNAGRGRVLKSYSTEDSLTTWAKVHKYLPKETQSYVHKIYLKHNFYKKYFLP